MTSNVPEGAVRKAVVNGFTQGAVGMCTFVCACLSFNEVRRRSERVIPSVLRLRLEPVKLVLFILVLFRNLPFRDGSCGGNMDSSGVSRRGREDSGIGCMGIGEWMASEADDEYKSSWVLFLLRLTKLSFSRVPESNCMVFIVGCWVLLLLRPCPCPLN